MRTTVSSLPCCQDLNLNGPVPIGCSAAVLSASVEGAICQPPAPASTSEKRTHGRLSVIVIAIGPDCVTEATWSSEPPSTGDFQTALKLAVMDAPLKASPLWNFTPGRAVIVQTVEFALCLTDLARYGTTSLSSLSASSGSKMVRAMVWHACAHVLKTGWNPVPSPSIAYFSVPPRLGAFLAASAPGCKYSATPSARMRRAAPVAIGRREMGLMSTTPGGRRRIDPFARPGLPQLYDKCGGYELGSAHVKTPRIGSG